MILSICKGCKGLYNADNFSDHYCDDCDEYFNDDELFEEDQ